MKQWLLAVAIAFHAAACSSSTGPSASPAATTLAEFEKRVTPTTEFHLASLTKTFASTIVLQLVERGQFLSNATRTLAYTPARGANNRVLPYGLGWFISDVGGHTLVWHYEPGRGLTFVALTNSEQLSARFKLGSGDLMSSTVAQAFVNAFVTGSLH